jgi:hypothetical protein
MLKKIVSTLLLFIGISFAADTTWCMNFGNKQLGYVNWHDSVQVCPFPNPCRYEYLYYGRLIMKSPTETVSIVFNNDNPKIGFGISCYALAFEYPSTIWFRGPSMDYILFDLSLNIIDTLPDSEENVLKFIELKNTSIIITNKNIKKQIYKSTNIYYDLRGRVINNKIKKYQIKIK